MPQSEQWLSLKKAAALMGVDETTLRHWADSGKVPVYRTQGGHRRFRGEDLRALLIPTVPGGADQAAAFRRRSLHLVAGLPERRMRAAGWFSGLDESFRDRARAHGRQVVDLLAQAVGGGGASRAAAVRITTLGREYGRDLRLAGLSFAQATEAFTFFRDLVLTRSIPTGGSETRALREISRLLDRMLVAMAQGCEGAEEPAS